MPRLDRPLVPLVMLDLWEAQLTTNPEHHSRIVNPFLNQILTSRIELSFG
jgi:hypothetical protein